MAVVEDNKFTRETIDKYLIKCKELYPEKDTLLLEICIAQYLLYDVQKIERPDNKVEAFINANNKLQELIQQTREINNEK